MMNAPQVVGGKFEQLPARGPISGTSAAPVSEIDLIEAKARRLPSLPGLTAARRSSRSGWQWRGG